MIKKSALVIAILTCLLSSGNVFAYEFWGITIGTQEHAGATQLTFDGVAASGAQNAVGGYEYTQVDSDWLGPFPAASPGAGYLASRKSDAQGLFFKADPDYAKFVIIAGSAQTGAPAPEVGAGARFFGPGDLKIDANGHTYGVGLRISGLIWALDPATTNPEYLIYYPDGTIADIHSRDEGTLFGIEMDPTWARMGHSALPANSEMGSAFYIDGTGVEVGAAEVTFEDTGLRIEGAGIFAYQVNVPWTALQVDPENFEMVVRWGPDCGNDIIKLDVTKSFGPQAVPEPSTFVVVLGGVASLAALKKRG